MIFVVDGDWDAEVTCLRRPASSTGLFSHSASTQLTKFTPDSCRLNTSSVVRAVSLNEPYKTLITEQRVVRDMWRHLLMHLGSSRIYSTIQTAGQWPRRNRSMRTRWRADDCSADKIFPYTSKDFRPSIGIHCIQKLLSSVSPPRSNSCWRQWTADRSCRDNKIYGNYIEMTKQHVATHVTSHHQLAHPCRWCSNAFPTS
jgi:hypothetical protein